MEQQRLGKEEEQPPDLCVCVLLLECVEPWLSDSFLLLFSLFFSFFYISLSLFFSLFFEQARPDTFLNKDTPLDG